MAAFFGLLLIVAGIVNLAFPGLVRGLNQLGNEMEGVETKHGPAFEANRVISGIVMIIGGIVIMGMGF